MLEYRNDPEFRIDYDQVINKIAFPLNRVGHLTVVPILPPTGDLVLDDDNSMAVDGDTGSDTTGDGTATNPFATIVHGMDSTTEVRPYVRVMNSGLYNEDLSTFTNRSHFSGLYAEPGETPTIDYKMLGFIPSNSNSIFVKKTGSDTTGDGTMENPVLTIEKAITLCDASHQKVGIMDNGKYIEKAFTFVGNFLMLFAMVGCCPEISIDSTNRVPDITVAEGEAVCMSSTYGQEFSSLKLPNGTIFMVGTYGSNNPITYTVLDTDGTTILIPLTSISPVVNGSGRVVACITKEGNILIFFFHNVSDSFSYMILSSLDFSVIKTVTQIYYTTSSTSLHSGVVTTSSGKVLFIYYSGSGNTMLYRVLNTTDYSLSSQSTLTSAVYNKFRWPRLILLDSGDILVLANYTQASSDPQSVIYHIIKDTDPVFYLENPTGVILATTAAYGDVYSVGACDMADGRIFLCFSFGIGPAYSSRYMILNSDLSIALDKTILHPLSQNCTYFQAELLDNGNIFVKYLNYSLGSTSLPRRLILSAGADSIILQINTSIIGCRLSCYSTPYLRKFIQSTSSPIVLKYVSLFDIFTESGTILPYVIQAGAAFTSDRLSIRSASRGIFIESNIYSMTNSQITGITDDYAIHIKGTAAALGDIILDQLDIFNNYGGVYAEDWGGTNEIIRNSIFYLNGAYDVFSDDNQITVGYSIMTGAVNSLVAKQNCLAKNPLYINEGAYNPDDLDLNIKMRILGYKADSPAYQLADATPDRNAGSLNVIYVGAMDTWSTIFLPKPVNGFNVGYRLIGADTLEKLEGADSKVDAILEEVQSEYADGLEWENFQKILTLFSVKKSLVKLFPDPVTYPDFHNEYMIDWEKCKLPGSGGHIKFDQRGVKGVILAFIRGYV